MGGGGGRPGWAPLGGDCAVRALAESASLCGAEKSWMSETVGRRFQYYLFFFYIYNIFLVIIL